MSSNAIGQVPFVYCVQTPRLAAIHGPGALYLHKPRGSISARSGAGVGAGVGADVGADVAAAPSTQRANFGGHSCEFPTKPVQICVFSS
jgi:hypothetical protein